MTTAITLTAYNRPAYLRQALLALRFCSGIGDCVLLPQVEPGCAEVEALVSDWDGCQSRPAVNRHRLGLNKNTYTVLQRAYESGFSTIIHLEDDILPSPDAIEYLQWAVDQVDRLPDALIASGFSRSIVRPHEKHTAALRHVFTPILWATNRTRLKVLFDAWSFRRATQFTYAIRQRFSRSKFEVYPLLSRSRTIGYENGTNPKSRKYYAKFYDVSIAGESGELGGCWTLDIDRPTADLPTSR